ncbi:helix-turn-helix transcriptional regulator [Pseudolactococcus chungangensis]|uniref:helix-turn-helix transcriptional regulator n=1 Tax=Pseudolactococcus chungangensis TaxID=451457 RepID=UPI0028D6C3F0|nr:helix-turn-helix transcriptional regulator [Lactococcus chungangensis]
MAVNRLNALRKERNLTLKELSSELSKIGIKATHSQLGYWEKGERSPRKENTWKQLADFFNVSESYLLGYSDNRKNADERLKEKISEDSLKAEELKKDILELQKMYDNLKDEYERFLKKPFNTIEDTALYKILDLHGRKKLATSSVENKKDEFIVSYEEYLEGFNKELLTNISELEFIQEDIANNTILLEGVLKGSIFSLNDRVNPDFEKNGKSQKEISEELKVIPYVLNYEATMKVVEYADMLREKDENRFNPPTK